MGDKCLINIKLESENDVYFGIANTILSYDAKKNFTVDDIVEELRSLNWESVFDKYPIKKMVEISIKNLIEHGKVIEEPRWYVLAENC